MSRLRNTAPGASSVCYDLHGLTVGVVCDDPDLSEAVRARLAPLAIAACTDPDLRMEVVTSGVERPPGTGRPVYDAPAGPVLYYEGPDALHVDYRGRLQWRCDATAGVTRVSIPSLDPEDLWLAAHPLLNLALTECHKRRGRYGLHAACVSHRGRGLVLAGPSGAGKSTTAVALALAGMHFLSDDVVFLEPAAAGLRVVAFPDQVDFTDHTGMLLPALVPASAAGSPWRSKRSVRPEAVGLILAPWCTPGALVLVEVAAVEHTRLVPVDGAEALMELLPNVLLTDPEFSQSHLDALGELTSSVPCYRLSVGRDTGQMVALVAQLVA